MRSSTNTFFVSGMRKMRQALGFLEATSLKSISHVPRGLGSSNGLRSTRTDPMATEIASNWTRSVVELVAAAVPSLTFTVYKSGAAQTSLTFNEGATRTFASLTVGGSAHAFAGRVDDVRLYSVALSASQIASLYSSTASG